MNFRTWLFAQKRRNDPIGDLAQDAFWLEENARSKDRKLPRTDDYKLLRSYLNRMNACREALLALALAHREWRRAA